MNFKKKQIGREGRRITLLTLIRHGLLNYLIEEAAFEVQQVKTCSSG